MKKIKLFMTNYWGAVACLIMIIIYFIALPRCLNISSNSAEEAYVQIKTDNVNVLDPEKQVNTTYIKDEEQILPEVLSPSNITTEELQSKLRGLAPYAEVFIQAEVQTGVNAKFLAAIAALESGWGRSDLAKNNNNLFGWTCDYGYEGFGTKQECILMVAHDLKDKYLSIDGEYFEGWSIEDIAKHYNTVNPAWASTVKQIMTMLGE